MERDTLFGSTDVGASMRHDQALAVVAIPVSDVRRVQIRQASGGRTAAAALGAIIGVALVRNAMGGWR